MRRVLRMSLIVAALVALSPAVAQAHRAPTAQERAGIEAAIRGGIRGPYSKLVISRIEVSSFGQWATATFTVHFPHDKHHELPTSGVFAVVHGKWVESPYLTPSKKVKNDLRLYVSRNAPLPKPKPAAQGASKHTIHLIEYIGGGVLIFLVLAGMIRIATFSPEQRKEWEERLWRKRVLDALDGIRAKL